MVKASEQDKLKREARIFSALAGFGVGLAILCVTSQILIVAAPLWRGGNAHRAAEDIAIQVLLAVPALSYALGMLRARRVFKRVGAGEMLTAQNSRGLAGVGLCLLVGAIWSLTISDGVEPLQSSQLPDYIGQIAADARAFALAAVGLAMVMIGRVWAAAVRLKDENDSIL